MFLALLEALNYLRLVLSINQQWGSSKCVCGGEGLLQLGSLVE